MRLIEGDCVEVLGSLDEASVDSIVTDPPYGLGFMGKAWDRPACFQAWVASPTGPPPPKSDTPTT